MEHGLACFARLVRLFLGSDAIAESKQACGTSLTVLGINFQLSQRGYRCRPSEDKVSQWSEALWLAIAEGRLLPGCASKLAGRL